MKTKARLQQTIQTKSLESHWVNPLRAIFKRDINLGLTIFTIRVIKVILEESKYDLRKSKNILQNIRFAL